MNDFSRRAFIFGGATAASAFVFLSVNELGSYALADPPEPDSKSGPVTIIEFSDEGQPLRSVTREKIKRTRDEWKKKLSVDSYRVTRRAGTESPETGELVHEHRAGIFRCIC